MQNYRKRILLEYQVGTQGQGPMNQIDFLVSQAQVTSRAETLPFFSDSKNQWIVLILADSAKPILQTAFKKGPLFNLLKAGGYGNYKEIDGRLIDQTLRNFCSDGSVSGLNVTAQDYLIDINKQIEVFRIDKEKPNHTVEWMKIFDAYTAELEAFNCSPKEFFQDRSQICPLINRVMYLKFEIFEKAYEIKQKVLGDGAEQQTLQQSLDLFLVQNPVEKSGEECLEIIRKALHYEILETLVTSFFNRSDQKKHTLWIHGSTSSGKSEFLKQFKQIFSCQRGDYQKGHLCCQPRSQHLVETQFVICPEFNIENALERNNLPNVLQMWEGQGGSVKPNLYEKYVLSFDNVFFIVASNRLPMWSEYISADQLFMGQTNERYQHDWLPLMTRCDRVELKKSFEKEVFPYDARILAKAIQTQLDKVNQISSQTQSEQNNSIVEQAGNENSSQQPLLCAQIQTEQNQNLHKRYLSQNSQIFDKKSDKISSVMENSQFNFGRQQNNQLELEDETMINFLVGQKRGRSQISRSFELDYDEENKNQREKHFEKNQNQLNGKYARRNPF